MEHNTNTTKKKYNRYRLITNDWLFYPLYG